MRKGLRIIIIIVVTLLSPAIIAAIFYLVTSLTLWRCPDGWDQAKPGLTYTEIRSVIGAPQRKCELKSGYPECVIEGYGIPPHSDAKSVYIYLGCDKAFYIFFDNKGLVQSTWWGTS